MCESSPVGELRQPVGGEGRPGSRTGAPGGKRNGRPKIRAGAPSGKRNGRPGIRAGKCARAGNGSCGRNAAGGTGAFGKQPEPLFMHRRDRAQRKSKSGQTPPPAEAPCNAEGKCQNILKIRLLFRNSMVYLNVTHFSTGCNEAKNSSMTSAQSPRQIMWWLLIGPLRK